MHNIHDKTTRHSSQTKTEEKKKMYFGDIEYSVDMQDNVFQAYDESKIPKRTINFEHFIKLPLYRQGYDFTCGVACVMSILRYAGYEFDTREDRLLWKLGSTPAEGTNCKMIEQFLNSVGKEYDSNVCETFLGAALDLDTNYDADTHDEKIKDLMCNLRKHIDLRQPVICVIQAWREDGKYCGENEDGHYVILVGYEEVKTDEYVYYFMDPSTSYSYTYLPEKDFVDRWHDEYVDENGIKESLRISIVIHYKKQWLEREDVAFFLG